MRPVTVHRIKKTFQDTFNRPDESLERASDGGLWNIVRGTWSVVSNKISTSSLPTSYPIVTSNTETDDVDISIKDISQGTVAALWVSNSGDWWGVGIDREAGVNCNCQTCANYVTNYYTCATGSYYCKATNNYSCSGSNCSQTGYIKVTGSCINYTCNANCKSWTNQGGVYRCANWYGTCCAYNTYYYSYCINFNSVYNINYGTCSTTNVSGYYSCNCQTCYPQYIRLIQSVSNTISTIVSTQVQSYLTSVVRSLKVLVRKTGDTTATVTAKVYSDTSLVTQLGSDIVYTPTDIAITPTYGIIIRPSSYSQGSTTGEIVIENM